jgi:hypothetical protein
MAEFDRFEQLVALAKSEVPPPVDVADSVVAAIRCVRVGRQSAVDRWTLGFTAASVLAASVMAMIVWQSVDQPVIAEVPNPFVGPVMSSE